MPNKATLLIVDDDELIQDVLSAFFEEHFNVVSAKHLKEVKSALAQLEQPPEYALMDLGLPPTPHRPDEGFAAISILQAQAPECAIVVVSGQDSRRHGQRARALGATEYVEKPCDPKTLLQKLQLARQIKLSEQQVHGLIGESAVIETLRQQIALIAPVDFPVLIEGESGVGKELVARALHSSTRNGKPFLAINCAAIPEHLVEPTLFGNVKGAFTGAAHENAGYLGDSADGTLLLDEVGDLPDSIQPKLLRVLETGEYQKVGETRTRRCSARILSASNREQQRGHSRKSGHIRDDLYYRLGVFTITVPPLRQMGEDRFILLNYFSQKIAKDLSTPSFTLTQAARNIFAAYSFPGNVRELKNIAARLQVKYSGNEVDEEQLLAELCNDLPTTTAEKIDESAPALVKSPNLSNLENEIRLAAEQLAAQTARQTLMRCGGNTAEAARELQISERNFKLLLTLPF